MDGTIQRSLKELYYSLGGNADNVRDTYDVNAILAAMTALGLGEQIAEGGGGGDVLVINATIDAEHATEDGYPLIIDKTYDEIAGAATSEVHVDMGGYIYCIPLLNKYVSEMGGMFGYASIVAGTATTVLITGNSEAIEANLANVTVQFLPVVDATDNGKILKVQSGEWTGVYNEFVITCTPTAQDLSGTMDKTPAEILAAYQAGKNIRMRVVTDANSFSEIIPESYNATTVDGEVTSVVIAATFVYHVDGGVNYLVQAVTSSSTSTYSTQTFALTSPSP